MFARVWLIRCYSGINARMKLFRSFVMSAFAIHVTYSIVVDINRIKIEKIPPKTYPKKSTVESSSSCENTRTPTIETKYPTDDAKPSQKSCFVSSTPMNTTIWRNFENIDVCTESYTKSDDFRRNFTNDGNVVAAAAATANASTSVGVSTTGIKIPSNFTCPAKFVPPATSDDISSARTNQPVVNRSGADDDSIDRFARMNVSTTILTRNARQNSEKEPKPIPVACSDLGFNSTECTTTIINATISLIEKNGETSTAGAAGSTSSSAAAAAAETIQIGGKLSTESTASPRIETTCRNSGGDDNNVHTVDNFTVSTRIIYKSSADIGSIGRSTDELRTKLQSTTVRPTNTSELPAPKTIEASSTFETIANLTRIADVTSASTNNDTFNPSTITLTKHALRTSTFETVKAEETIGDTSPSIAVNATTPTSSSSFSRYTATPGDVGGNSSIPIETPSPSVQTTFVDTSSSVETDHYPDSTRPSSPVTIEQQPMIDYEECRSSESSNRSGGAFDRVCRVLAKARRDEIRQRCGNDHECLRRHGLVPSYVPDSVRRATVSSHDPARSRNLTAVRPIKGNVSSNAGFLLANPRHGTRLFFWFVRSTRADPRRAPLVVWLQGQPGWSSLYGFFEEHGPYRVVETSSNGDDDGGIRFKLRESAWTNEFNVLYLDHCVGCGFSFSLRRIAYKPTYETVAKNVYRALSEFFAVWPEYAENDMYLAGEHGCAKYIPIIAHSIYERNAIEWTKMNLKGLLIGGPYADAISMVGYGDYMYTVGIIDENELDTVWTCEEQAKSLIRAAKYDEAIRYLRRHLYSKFDQAGYRKLYDLRYTKPKNGLYRFESYMPKVMADKRLIRSIHAENLEFRNKQSGITRTLIEDIMKPMDDILTDVLKNYKICYYNGQFDMLTPYSSTAAYFSKLDWPKTNSFYTSDLNNWYATSEHFPDGYWKYSNNLTHVLIRDAGHTVGTTRPDTLVNLLKWFVDGKFEKSYTPPSPNLRYLNVYE